MDHERQREIFVILIHLQIRAKFTGDISAHLTRRGEHTSTRSTGNDASWLIQNLVIFLYAGISGVARLPQSAV